MNYRRLISPKSKTIGGEKTARIDEKLLTAVGLKLFTPNEDKFARSNY